MARDATVSSSRVPITRGTRTTNAFCAGDEHLDGSGVVLRLGVAEARLGPEEARDLDRIAMDHSSVASFRRTSTLSLSQGTSGQEAGDVRFPSAGSRRGQPDETVALGLGHPVGVDLENDVVIGPRVRGGALRSGLGGGEAAEGKGTSRHQDETGTNESVHRTSSKAPHPAMPGQNGCSSSR